MMNGSLKQINKSREQLKQINQQQEDMPDNNNKNNSKILISDNIKIQMFPEFNKTNNNNRLDEFISATKRNGYFGKLKELSRGKNTKSDLDSMYRKKAEMYYAKKIKKPFRLVDQPEYKREKQFFSNFNSFIASIPEFEKIEEPQDNNTLRAKNNKRIKEIFSETLICDPSRDSEMSPQNIEKRRRNKTHEKEDDYNSAERSAFPTSINYDLNKIKFKSTENRNKNKNTNANANINKLSSKRIEESPLKIYDESDKSPQSSNRRNFSTYRTFQVKKSKSRSSAINQQSFRKIEIHNEDHALLTLNILTGADPNQKKRNFRVGKTQLHEILKKKYGNQLITSFFQMQALEDFNGTIKIIKEIINSSPTLAQLLTFLTFDYNQDGVITEDELTKLQNIITVDNQINEDINTLVAYCKANPKASYDPDLPEQFIKNPTYKEYLKINSLYKTDKGENIRGVMRFFTLRVEEEEENYDSKSVPVSLNKANTEFIEKKYIRVNFNNFQKAFGNKKPKFIENLLYLLIGDQTPIIQQNTEEEVSSPTKKINTSYQNPTTTKKNPKSKILNGLSKIQTIENRTLVVQSSSRLNQSNLPEKAKKVNLFLKTMKDQKKKLETIQYV